MHHCAATLLTWSDIGKSLIDYKPFSVIWTYFLPVLLDPHSQHNSCRLADLKSK